MQDRLEISKARNVTGLRLASEWAGDPGIMPGCRERFKFMSPRKNLPFKEQMLPPLYQNHLFVFIALVSYLDASQPRLI